MVETGDLITTLDDTSVIKVDFDVPEVYLSRLAPGLVVLDEAYHPFAQASFMHRLTEYDNLLVMRYNPCLNRGRPA